MALYIGTSFVTNSDGIAHKSFQSIGINTNFEFVGFATNPSPNSGGEFVVAAVAVGSGRIVVGDQANNDLALNAGKAYIFDLDGNEVGILTGSGGENDGFGYSVAVGSGRIVVGEPNNYAAHIFDLDGNKLNTITGDGTYGVSVDIRNKKIAVGERLNNEIYLYDLDGNNELNIDFGPAGGDFTGWSVAIGYDRVVIGSPYNDDVANTAGKSFIYDLDGNQLGSITASDGAANDYFGQSLAVGSGRIVVGAINAGINTTGQVYIYEINGNEVGIITASDGAADDEFGSSVAVGSGRIVVGSPYNDEVALWSGKVYLYDIDGNEVGIITASDGAAYDRFGESVAVGDNRIVVGRRNGSVSIYKINETLSDYYDEIIEYYRY